MNELTTTERSDLQRLNLRQGFLITSSYNRVNGPKEKGCNRYGLMIGMGSIMVLLSLWRQRALLGHSR